MVNIEQRCIVIGQGKKDRRCTSVYLGLPGAYRWVCVVCTCVGFHFIAHNGEHEIIYYSAFIFHWMEYLSANVAPMSLVEVLSYVGQYWNWWKRLCNLLVFESCWRFLCELIWALWCVVNLFGYSNECYVFFAGHETIDGFRVDRFIESCLIVSIPFFVFFLSFYLF